MASLSHANNARWGERACQVCKAGLADRLPLHSPLSGFRLWETRTCK